MTAVEPPVTSAPPVGPEDLLGKLDDADYLAESCADVRLAGYNFEALRELAQVIGR